MYAKLIGRQDNQIARIKDPFTLATFAVMSIVQYSPFDGCKRVS
jgi:hypothetical protein